MQPATISQPTRNTDKEDFSCSSTIFLLKVISNKRFVCVCELCLLSLCKRILIEKERNFSQAALAHTQTREINVYSCARC